jgi:CheY-like chemotaxis protein
MITKQLKIILVDDDQDDRELFSDALEELKLNTTFLSFENGILALDYLRKIDDFLETHIFLDLNMPILSGMECLKLLREFTLTPNPFITIYSTSAVPLTMEEAYKYGANGYLQKPTNFTILKESLHQSILGGVINRNVE